MVVSFFFDLLCFHVDQPKVGILFSGNQIDPFIHIHSTQVQCHLLGLMHR